MGLKNRLFSFAISYVLISELNKLMYWKTLGHSAPNSIYAWQRCVIEIWSC